MTELIGFAIIIIVYVIGIVVSGILNDNVEYSRQEFVYRIIWWPIYLIKHLLKSFWYAISSW